MILQATTLIKAVDEFQAQVAKSKGKVLLLVHPFFDLQKAKQTPLYLDKLRAVASRSKIPVIVLDAQSEIRDKGVFTKSNHFVIPSSPFAAQPAMTWDYTHEFLKKAGVKTVLIGGMLSYANPHSSFKSDELHDIRRRRAIAAYEKQNLRVKPKRSVHYGCVAVAYESFIKANQDGKYEKIRLLPAVLSPNKLSFKKEKKEKRRVIN